MKGQTAKLANLDQRLYRMYRLSIYAFGGVTALAIFGGTWFGLQMVQKHDQKYVQQGVSKTTTKGSAIANPYRQAETVEFYVPYLHGADPNTISYITAISQQQTGKVANGFTVEGVYQSGNIKETVSLEFACKDALCHLEFKLPARLVLTPQFDGKRFKKPQREYQILSHGYVFEILNSELVGIHPENNPEIAVFSDNLNVKPFYKESYFDHQGKQIQP